MAFDATRIGIHMRGAQPEISTRPPVTVWDRLLYLIVGGAITEMARLAIAYWGV